MLMCESGGGGGVLLLLLLLLLLVLHLTGEVSWLLLLLLCHEPRWLWRAVWCRAVGSRGRVGCI